MRTLPFLFLLFLASCASEEDLRIEAFCKGDKNCIDQKKMERYIQKNKAQSAAAGGSKKEGAPQEDDDEDGINIWGYTAPWRHDVWGRPQ